MASLAVAVSVTPALGSHRPLTRANAHAVAAAINLRQGDLPRLAAQSNPITAAERRFAAQLTACLGGVPDSEAYATAQSPNFTGSGPSALTISSSSEILPTPALVAKDLAAIKGPKAIPCIQRQLGKQLKASLAKGDTLAIHGALLPALVSRSDGAFALRFSAVVAIKAGNAPRSLHVYYDTIGFAYRQAEVGLDVLSISAKPSAALERRLGASLLTRARAAIG